MAKVAPQRRVQCYHCRHRFDISSRAMSVPCPKCAKALIVEDIVITNPHNVRKIQTCGKVIIEKKGRVVAQSIEAHEGVFVEGYLEAKVLSGGPVHIGPKAHWKGDCSAPTLAAELGCRIDRGHFSIPDDPLGVAGLHESPPGPEASQPTVVPHLAAPIALPTSKPSKLKERHSDSPRPTDLAEKPKKTPPSRN